MDTKVTPTTDNRAVMVAAIRALADLLETRTDLPLPNSVHAQHSLFDLDPSNEMVIRRAAALLDARIVVRRGQAYMRHELSPYPVSVSYTVAGSLPEVTS